MRLFNIVQRRVEVVDEQLFAPDDDDQPSELPYVVISHRWVNQTGPRPKKEITFEDIKNIDIDELLEDPQPEQYDSAAKFQGALKQVLDFSSRRMTTDALQKRAQPIDHFWIDTCCIDQGNLAELSMSINSMYRWYKRAVICFAYLYDYEVSSSQSIIESGWFKRGWTLQELVAPKEMEFFDKNWIPVGTKETLQAEISSRTRIDRSILQMSQKLHHPSVAHRMSWYHDRETKLPEDAAYCLMGLFDVHMPTMYGEGLRSSFRRLQEEIVKYADDHTIFAWKQPENVSVSIRQSNRVVHESGPFATSPACFSDTGIYTSSSNRHNSKPFHLTNKGLQIQLYLQRVSGDLWVAALDIKADSKHDLGIYLRCLSTITRQFCRTRSSEFCLIDHVNRGELKEIYIRSPPV